MLSSSIDRGDGFNMSRLKKIAKTVVLKETEWVSLYDRDGYIYSHESRCYKNATVAILPFRIHNNKLQLLIRYEYTPSHYVNKQMEATAITGGYDDSSITIADTAVKELLEEGGYRADINQLIPFDWCWEGKASDTKVYLYAIDLTDTLERETPKGDGSEGEVGAYCKWEDYNKNINYRCMRLNNLIYKIKEKKPELFK